MYHAEDFHYVRNFVDVIYGMFYHTNSSSDVSETNWNGEVCRVTVRKINVHVKMCSKGTLLHAPYAFVNEKSRRSVCSF